MATTGQKVAYAVGAAFGVVSLVGLAFYILEKSSEEPEAPKLPPEKKPGIWVSETQTPQMAQVNQVPSPQLPPPESQYSPYT